MVKKMIQNIDEHTAVSLSMVAALIMATAAVVGAYVNLKAHLTTIKDILQNDVVTVDEANAAILQFKLDNPEAVVRVFEKRGGG